MSSPFPPPSDPRREPSWDDVTWSPPTGPAVGADSPTGDPGRPGATPPGSASPASPSPVPPRPPHVPTTPEVSRGSTTAPGPALRDEGRRGVRQVQTGRLLLGVLALLVAIFTAGPAVTGTPWLPHLGWSTWLLVIGAACVLLGLVGLLAGPLSRRHRDRA